MIDSWTIAKGLLLYTGIVTALCVVGLLLAWTYLVLARAIRETEDARAKAEYEIAERERLRVAREVREKRREEFRKSRLGKATEE